MFLRDFVIIYCLLVVVHHINVKAFYGISVLVIGVVVINCIFDWLCERERNREDAERAAERAAKRAAEKAKESEERDYWHNVRIEEWKSSLNNNK